MIEHLLTVFKLITIMLEKNYVIFLDFFTFIKEITKSWSVIVVTILNR